MGLQMTTEWNRIQYCLAHYSSMLRKKPPAGYVYWPEGEVEEIIFLNIINSSRSYCNSEKACWKNFLFLQPKQLLWN